MRLAYVKYYRAYHAALALENCDARKFKLRLVFRMIYDNQFYRSICWNISKSAKFIRSVSQELVAMYRCSRHYAHTLWIIEVRMGILGNVLHWQFCVVFCRLQARVCGHPRFERSVQSIPLAGARPQFWVRRWRLRRRRRRRQPS